MLRNVLVLMGGVALSLCLFVLAGWFSLRFSVMGKIVAESAVLGRAMDGSEVVAKFGDPFKSMEKAIHIVQYVIFPLGVITIGVYVGLLAKAQEVLIALLTILPFITIYGSTNPSRLAAFGLGLFYLGLCCLGTCIATRGRARTRKHKDLSNTPLEPSAEARGSAATPLGEE